MTLLQYLGGGKDFPRGSVKRVCDYFQGCGVTMYPAKLKLLLFGIVKPDAATARLMQDFVIKRQSIAPKRTGKRHPKFPPRKPYAHEFFPANGTKVVAVTGTKSRKQEAGQPSNLSRKKSCAFRKIKVAR